jgi:hypothetical protein
MFGYLSANSGSYALPNYRYLEFSKYQAECSSTQRCENCKTWANRDSRPQLRRVIVCRLGRGPEARSGRIRRVSQFAIDDGGDRTAPQDVPSALRRFRGSLVPQQARQAGLRAQPRDDLPDGGSGPRMHITLVKMRMNSSPAYPPGCTKSDTSLSNRHRHICLVQSGYLGWR